MDPVIALVREADNRALYYLWERQGWEAGKIDLSPDSQQWGHLDPALRRAVGDSVAWRRQRAEVAISALVPFVDLAPDEEQQVFLTTQLVDEARHLVFFDRVQAEVFRESAGGSADRGSQVVDPALRSLLSDVVPRHMQQLREKGAGVAQLSAAMVDLHLVIVGALALTEQAALVSHLETDDALPGIRDGLTLEAGAAHRHVVFALGFLAEAVRRRQVDQAALSASLGASLLHARAALRSAARAAPTVFANLDLVQHAQGSLERWFAEVGLELSVRS